MPRATWIGAGVAATLFMVVGPGAAGARVPVVFEANRGQVDAQVKFLSRGPGFTLFITAAETILADRRTGERVRLRLVGARPEPEVVGLEPLPGRTHYFIGQNPLHWRTNVPTYARVAYREVYPGIDAVYRADAALRIEQDFLVQPGADPDAIRLELDGVQAASVDGAGDLVLATTTSQVRLSRPVAHQVVDGNHREIQAAWIVRGPREVGFGLGHYDRSLPLVIDPVITWATLLGGTGDDQAFGVALDAVGNVLVTGDTTSLDFPDASGLPVGTDAFVTKIDANGQSLIYSAYIGGSGTDGARAIAADSGANVYLAGFTDSPDFPITAGTVQPVHGGGLDGFVVKLDPTGAILYSTYLGGAESDTALGIAVDANGRAHVAGGTRSSEFPISNALQPTPGGGTCGIAPDTFPCRDAFVARLNPLGTDLEYSTFLGGSDDDAANGIALDRNVNAYVTGFTLSGNFPTTPGSLQPAPRGGLDAFVARVDADGSLGWSTYLGGSGSDTADGIAVDTAGRSHVVGSTASANFPATGGDSFIGATDGFVTKLDAAGSAVLWSRSTGSAVPTAVALNNVADVRLVANNLVCTMPTIPPGCAESHVDVVVDKRSGVDGHRLDIITFGGRSNLAAGQDFGQAIVTRGVVFLWVAGFTRAANFPTTPGTVQPAHQGGADAFVVKLMDPIDPITTNPPSGPPEGGFFPEGGVGGCLIATAAFGSPLAPEVQTLRQFRDRVLMTHPAGRALVRAYYRLSPPLAHTVARNPRLAAVVRGLLRPVALGVGVVLERPFVTIALTAIGLAMMLALGMVTRRRARPVWGMTLACLLVGAVLLVIVLALARPERPAAGPGQLPAPSPAVAREARPEPGVSEILAAPAPSTRPTPTARRAESGPVPRPLTTPPAPPTRDLLRDLTSREGSVRLINPLASRDARRWAVRSELIEGVLGADGFVVTDPRLTRGLGIEAGDTIVSVGSHPPRGLLAVLSAVQRDPDRATVLVEIDRGGARLVHSYRVR
jgi:hypothetical protein